MQEISYRPIGLIHSPFQEAKGTPIQPTGAEGVAGNAEIFPEYSAGLKDLDGFSHIILLCHFHLAKGYSLSQKPFMDQQERGIFAIRGPSRPNPIGLSIVRLTGIKDNIIYLKDLDILDGTPILDIKPYVPEFDQRDSVQIGWLEHNIQRLPNTHDDGRFEK